MGVQKVKTSSWKLSKDVLCTKGSKFKGKMEKEGVCDICCTTVEG
jgi:hypothetical protein